MTWRDKFRPVAADLCCGRGGWTIGLIAAGWEVIGFDIERWLGYPGQLVLQDIATIDGRRFRGKVRLIVASPPCHEPSYRAMPWKRAKALNAAGPPHQFMNLVRHCFRIAKEAQCPLVMENVKGAQPWIGPAKGHYGSYYLWGDVPVPLPKPTANRMKTATRSQQDRERCGGKSPHWTNPGEGIKQHGSGRAWFDRGICSLPSASIRRREASARIAMIPFPLAYRIGVWFLP